jgi:hypothetical protein
LLAFFIVLLVLWSRQSSLAVERAGRLAGPETAVRLADLPEGIRPGSDDFWAEALRRRGAGDLAGAVVALFGHQLLSLHRLGLIRIAPGRTGRHYVAAVSDYQARDALWATLRLFEDVYYGAKAPRIEAFESVWSRALAFEERRALLGAGAPR